MSIDLVDLGLIIIGILLLMLFTWFFDLSIITSILGLAEVVLIIIFLVQFAFQFEAASAPLKEAEEKYASYAETVLESYGYTDIDIVCKGAWDIGDMPGSDTYSPAISAAGEGDPDFNQIYLLLRDLNDYQENESEYNFESGKVTLKFHGQSGRYGYYGGMNEIYFEDNFYTEIRLNEETGQWIPRKPIEGMGESQILNTSLGNPTSVTETEEGTSYVWITGGRTNYEAIVTDGCVSDMRVYNG